MSILEVGDDGELHVPADLLIGAKPHAQFVVDVVGNVMLLRPKGESQPFWRQASAAERAEAFRRWAAAPRPPVPDFPDDALRREHLYD